MHKLLKEKFSAEGFEIFALTMPNTNEPKINDWVEFLKNAVGKADGNTYFIGHSVGCQTIMRYLETLQENTKVGRCIFIAGWFNLDNMEGEEEERIAKPWIEKPINLNKVKKIAKEITVFISSNEYYGYIKENSTIFREKLGAKVIIEKSMGHFTDEEGEEKLYKFVSKIKL